MSNVIFLKAGQKRLIKRRVKRNSKRRKKVTGLLRKAPGIILVLLIAAFFQLDQSSTLRSLFSFKSADAIKSSSKRTLVGKASVVDGDTIRINGQKVRLHGIDAPETSQRCISTTGVRIRCGVQSARYLKRILRNNAEVTCKFVDRDRHGRFVGDCYRGDGKSLSAAMVRAGHALDWPKYSRRAYSTQQNRARVEKRGLWASRFEKPWDYRSRQSLSP
ncbi:MAG: thermonuclease family protein [Rhizobiaceae bacterium]|nr:thermonuclease family protein [Rhizobiaceae bacterium]